MAAQLDELVEKAEQLAGCSDTPFYFFDLDQVERTFLEHKAAWEHAFADAIIAYSYKTNSLQGVTRLLHSNGAHAEVVSGAEMAWALADGFQPEQIYFDGPVKTEAELRDAIALGAMIQVDSVPEAEEITRLAKSLERVPRVTLRVAVRRGRRSWSRFGLTHDEFASVARLFASCAIPVRGVHVNVGSNLANTKPHRKGVEESLRLLHSIRACSEGVPILDVGGGYPCSSSGRRSFPTVEAFAEQVAEAVERSHFSRNDLKLVVEPGRSIVEEQGAVVSRVVLVKTRGRKRILVCDAGTNLVRSISAWRHDVRLFPGVEGQRHTYDVYGSLCFESDLLARGIAADGYAGAGDLAIITNAGGYDIPSANIWIRPSPAVLGAYRGAVLTLRRAQTVSEMRATEAPTSEIVDYNSDVHVDQELR